jgi:hypothetical protein
MFEAAVQVCAALGGDGHCAAELPMCDVSRERKMFWMTPIERKTGTEVLLRHHLTCCIAFAHDDAYSTPDTPCLAFTVSVMLCVL